MDLRAAKYTTAATSSQSARTADTSRNVGGFGALVIDSSNNNNNQRLVVDGPSWDSEPCSSALWANWRSIRRPPEVNEKQRLPWQLHVRQPGKAGLEPSTIDPVSVITYSNTTNNANSRPSQQSRRLKALEHSINNLVEASCSTGVAIESALRLARESVDRLSSLRAQLAGQAQPYPLGHAPTGNRCTPLTSRPNASELALMVNSNLAAQLALSCQRREAIELYVDLCKLATIGVPQSHGLRQEKQQAIATGRRSASLLYRFGLNIGNLYCELGEHQQALKYYRLTLDRLSSLSVDYQSLRVKLMNNIVCCQLIQQAVVEPVNQSTLLADTINSMHHLLDENTLHSSATTSDPLFIQNNGRHHLYGLALVSLLSQTGAETPLMISTWQRHLVGVPVCHHYLRVSALPPAVAISHQSKSNEPRAPTGAPLESELSASLQHSELLIDGQPETTDQLELLIEEKQQETHGALLTCCQLILEQENKSHQSDGAKRSLFELCVSSLSSSVHYKGLAVDLKMNRAGELLQRQLNDEPLELLRQLSKRQQEEAPAPLDEMAFATSLAATNFTLLHLLLGSRERARHCALLATQANTFNDQTLINLANYYLQAGDLNRAHSLYRRALAVNPQSCQANYNLALLSRKLASGGHLLGGQEEQQLLTELKAYLIREQKWLAGLSRRGMILSMFQLASCNASLHTATAHRLQQSTLPILRQLLASLTWPPPEIYLFLASQATNATTTSTTDHNQQAIELLQQAHKEHPYHLPVLERLIALHIHAFNYDTAKPFLMSCIQNQPDQVKWYRLLAECHRRAADYATAITIYKISVSAFPTDTSCLKALINLTSELGMVEERNLYEKKLSNALRLNELLPEEVH